MDRYMKSILACSVISGMVESLFPGTALKKHLHYILSLITFLILLSPFLEVVPSIGGIYDSMENFLTMIEQAEEQGATAGKDLILSYGEGAVQERVKKLLKEKFQANPNEVDAELILGSEGRPIGITVILSKAATWLEESKVKGYLSEQFGCSIIIRRR